MEDTARLAKKSFTKVQLAGLLLIFVVFHTPPSTPATQTVLWVGSRESIIEALILPAVCSPAGRGLPPTVKSPSGPLSIHDKADIRFDEEFFDCSVC